MPTLSQCVIFVAGALLTLYIGNLDDNLLGDVYHSKTDFLKTYAAMEWKLKVFVQPVENGTSFSGAYASEGHFLKNIKETIWFRTEYPNRALLFFIPIPCRKLHQKIEWCNSAFGRYPDEGYILKTMTRDHPYRAHVFYVPVLCHLMHQKVAPHDKMELAVGRNEQSSISSVLDWNNSLGYDPVFLICDEIDPFPIEEVPVIPKNSIRVICSQGDEAGFILYKDISLPPVIQPPFFTDTAGGYDVHKRTILGYWEGICDTEIRLTLDDLWGDDDEFYIRCTTVQKGGKLEKIYSSKFCICPGGSGVTSICITMSIHYGCVPVIFADTYKLPFSNVLDWVKFSVILEEIDIEDLKSILTTKSGAEFEKLHSNLIKVKRHFQWNTPPVRYDAFHMVLYDLWLEVKRCQKLRPTRIIPFEQRMIYGSTGIHPLL